MSPESGALQGPRRIQRSDRQLNVPIVTFKGMDSAQRQELFNGRMSAEAIASTPLHFTSEYERYREMLAGDYTREIDGIADGFASQLRDAGVKPDVWVCVPTRREVHTTQAVEALQAMYGAMGLRAAILVFHNYSEPPLPETKDDLRALQERQDPVVFVVDRRVLPGEGMGDIRGYITDIAMATSVALDSSADPTIMSADADMTGYKNERAVRDSLIKLKNGELDAFSLPDRPDLRTITNNTRIFLEGLFVDAFDAEVMRYVLKHGDMPSFGGRATWVQGSALCAIGSYLPIGMAEDLSIAAGLTRLRGNTERLAIVGEAYVLTDQSKETLSEGRGAHYAAWMRNREVPKPSLNIDRRVNYYELRNFLIERYKMTRNDINSRSAGYALQERQQRRRRKEDESANDARETLQQLFLYLWDLSFTIERENEQQQGQGEFVPNFEDLIERVTSFESTPVDIDHPYDSLTRVQRILNPR